MRGLLGGLVAGAAAAVAAASKGRSSSGRSSSSGGYKAPKPKSPYEQYREKNPTYTFSAYDDQLARSNPAAADTLMRGKEMYYSAQAAGDRAGMDAAHKYTEQGRLTYGGYSGGGAGIDYVIQNPYTNIYEGMVKQGTDRLNAQRGGVNASYDDAARQAYIGYMQNQRAMPQQLAGAGITGGAAESSMIGARSTYEGNLNQISSSRQKAMQDIDTAILDLQNSGDVQTAQYILGNADKIAENYAQMAQSDVSRKDMLTEQAKQNEYNDASLTGTYKGKPTYAAQQDSFKRSLELLSMGFSSSEIAAYLGLPEQQIKQYAGLINQKMADSVYGSSSGAAGKSGSSGGGRKSSGSHKGSKGHKSSGRSNSSNSSNSKLRATLLRAGKMTQMEWARHKNSGNDTSGASYFKTYAEYLKAYNQYIASGGK